MKIIIALDPYKGGLGALEVAMAIELRFRKIWPDTDYVKIPVADGDEGTVEAVVAVTQGHLVYADVTSSLGDTTQVPYGLSGSERSAFIEVVAANGLGQVPAGSHDLLKTISWGTGELTRHALDAGTEHIIVGTGGGATNDGGVGMVQALGVKLLGAQNNEVAQDGISLESLSRTDISQLDSRLAGYRIEVICDVTNPLTGKEGTSTAFGPQKETAPEVTTRLDRTLTYYTQLAVRDLDVNMPDLAGGGTAGGMGAVLCAFCGTQLHCGIEIVTDALRLDACVTGADLMVTGERRIDSQTIHGKVPAGVARVAKRYNKPVVDITDSLTADVGTVYEHGLDVIFNVICSIYILDEALKNTSDDVRMTARDVVVTLKAGQQLH